MRKSKSKEKGIDNLQFPVEEAYKTLRSNILFSSIENEIQTIVVTSSTPGEGKTTTAINLAMAMAQGGYKTILVDCDQRKPRIHKVFGISNNKGLSNILIEQTTFNEALYEAKIDDKEIENLTIITSGKNPPNPSELLGCLRMKSLIVLLKREYEYIILDTPPLLLVTDAQIISQYADGCLLVVESGKTQIQAAVKAKSQLLKVNAKILGIVLNKVNVHRGAYYHYNDGGYKEE